MKRTEAIAFIEAFKTLREKVDDSIASMSVDIYPKMKFDGSLIRAGTRINWNGTIKRAAVDLFDTEAASPDEVDILWEDINYKGGHRIIPEVITAGLAFAKDECGWWGDVLYISLLDNNVWTPEAYPSGWSIVSD